MMRMPLGLVVVGGDVAEAGVSGNTFVVDGSGPRGYGRSHGYEQDGERYDTLTMTRLRRLHPWRATACSASTASAR